MRSILILFMLIVFVPPVFSAEPVSLPVPVSGSIPASVTIPVRATQSPYDQYLAYFNEIYKLMDEQYYFQVSPADLDRFLKAFNEKIYPSLLLEKKSNDYVRWRSAAYLVDFLKQPDDLFSRFLPPKPAQEFAKEVYGQRIDLGIEGALEASGFLVSFIEPRSDAYQQGLREGDRIVLVDEKKVQDLGPEKTKEKLNPLVGTKVRLDYVEVRTSIARMITVESKEYFKQTVFLKPTGVEGVYCLQIEKFNQGTPDDMARFVTFLSAKAPRGLVLDLRGNPGGPPLAARAISAFFLPNGEQLVYFEGRHRPRADLDIPVLPPQYRFDWPIVILVNKGTGSASELFSGVMQDRKRALILGEKTAGQVLLKSMFDMSDGSTMAMMVARGHFPDGRPFPFDGVVPNEIMASENDKDALTLAAKYLLLKAQGKL